jgi:hypothetical protein
MDIHLLIFNILQNDNTFIDWYFNIYSNLRQPD